MLFSQYQAHILTKKRALKLQDVDAASERFMLDPQNVRPAPPWQLDWCIPFKDQMHIRVKEFWRGKPHPEYLEGYRRTFGFHYGPTTGIDRRGWPKTQSNMDTIIRIDLDIDIGPHLCYEGRNHIPQECVAGIVIAEADLFDFIDAVRTHRESNGCPFEDILGFKVKVDPRCK
jgi:hypothetical protein